MSFLEPKTGGMFYFTGEHKTTPSCPVELAPDFNPSSASQSYENRDAQCSSNCQYVSLTHKNAANWQTKSSNVEDLFVLFTMQQNRELEQNITIITSALHTKNTSQY